MAAPNETTSSSSSRQTAETLKLLLVELPEERADAARLDELRRLLARLVAHGELSWGDVSDKKKKKASSASHKWNLFLQSCHKRTVSQLCSRMRQEKPTAVRCLWGVLAASPQCSANGNHWYVPVDLLYVFLQALVTASTQLLQNKVIHTMVQQEFIDPHLDVQYYAWVCVTRLAKELYVRDENDLTKQEAAERIFDLLVMIPVTASQHDLGGSERYLFTPATEQPNDEEEPDVDESNSDSELASDEESDSGESNEGSKDGPKDSLTRPSSSRSKRKSSFAFMNRQARRKAMLEAWLSVLKLPLPRHSLKTALQLLPHSILPNVTSPLRFADFLVQAYELDRGIVSLLALDGLFVLMTQHGLEYPLFYTSLYALVSRPSLFYAKYRVRYFELVTKCLMRNEMLPSHIVAAFAKRLLRSALSAPPPAALFCLALVSNLLRKHAECACLVHRDGVMEQDPFDATTLDPTEARALESSLWELSALSRHYYPAVAALAGSIGTEDGPIHDMNNFVRYTYMSLFDQERSTKRRRLDTPVTFVEPPSLFDDNDIFSGILEC